MTDTTLFAARIRERFPEGLTGILALGGTRTAYILGQNRETADPGRIATMQDYASYGLDLLREIITSFFELGGQNLIVSVLSYQQLSNERGAEYAESTSRLTLQLIDDVWQEYYRSNQVDPYFVGIDTLLHLPSSGAAYELGMKCQEFHQSWVYSEGYRKLVFEIAPIPLFSFWRASESMGAQAQAELDEQIHQAGSLQAIHDILYKYYARAAYGTDVPYPHFYMGTNRNGDLKLRSVLPIALLCGGGFRLYYTPYPSLFMKRETLQAILEDLAFGKPLRSTKLDYAGQITSEMINAEYARVQELSADPGTTLGLTRRIQVDE